DPHDVKIRVDQARRFLLAGHKVQITQRFRGREMAHMELGTALLKRVEEDMQEFATVDQYPQSEGRQMTMLLVPKKR
ncbi:MAG: translation initiation factor IF-3, partial [Gammaproteobacteria bacterium]